MGIEQSLERIAAALETLAGYPPKYPNPVPLNTRMKEEAMPAQQIAHLTDLSTLPVTTAESNAAIPAKTDREILMAECDAAKLPYPAKASVKRLKETLATYGKQGTLPIAEPAANAVIPQMETKNYTKPEAKEVLMRFAAKYGMDKAMKIITGFNVKDLSGVEAAGKLNELVEVTLKAEADHGKK